MNAKLKENIMKSDLKFPGDVLAQLKFAMLINLIAKCYAMECEKFLETVVQHECLGCALQKSKYHFLCLKDKKFQIDYCQELLLQLFDEKAVSENLTYFLNCLGTSDADISMSQDVSVIAQRRKLLLEASFWELISQYYAM